MKVINLVSTSLSKKGGMPRYMAELAENLAESGFFIYFYCLRWDGETLKNHPSIQVKSFGYLKHVPKLIKYILFAAIIHLIINKKALLTISAARLFSADIAIVGGTHLGFTQRLYNGRRSLYDRFEIWLETKFYRSAKKIVAHSPLMVDELCHYPIKQISKKTIMLFAPLQQKQFSFVDASNKVFFKKKLGLPLDKIILLTVGTEQPLKGVKKLVEALSLTQHPEDYFLIILGKHYRAPLPNNSRFLGLKENIQDYYAAADLTVVASEYEAFSLVTCESLQVGTPVILSPCVGARVLVNEKNSLIMPDNAPISIAQTLDKAREKTFHCEKNFSEKQLLLTWQYHIQEMNKIIQSIN